MPVPERLYGTCSKIAEALEKQEDLGGIVVVEGRVVGQCGVAVAGKDGTQGDQHGPEIGGFVGLAVELVEDRARKTPNLTILDRRPSSPSQSWAVPRPD